MKAFLVLFQMVYALCLLPWLLIMGITLMGFANGINWFSTALSLGIGLFPIAVVACSIYAWKFRTRRKRAALMINLVPMAWILLIGVPFIAINL